MEIPLVPIAVFSIRRGGQQCSRDVLNVVPGDRDEPRNSLWPQRRHDASGTTTPIIARKYCSPDAEPIHQTQEIAPERSLLAGTQGSRIAEAGRPIAAQIWNDDPPSGGGERGRDAVISVHVIRKSVHQEDCRAIPWTMFLVSNLQCRSQDGVHGVRHSQLELRRYSRTRGEVGAAFLRRL